MQTIETKPLALVPLVLLRAHRMVSEPFVGHEKIKNKAREKPNERDVREHERGPPKGASRRVNPWFPNYRLNKGGSEEKRQQLRFRPWFRFRGNAARGLFEHL